MKLTDPSKMYPVFEKVQADYVICGPFEEREQQYTHWKISVGGEWEVVKFTVLPVI